MGILDDIGFFENGDLSNSAVNSFLDSVKNEAQNPITKIGDVDLPIQIQANPESLQAFEPNLSTSEHRDKYATYHKAYVDGMYKTTAKILNIPANAILKNLVPVPIFDPTNAILTVLNLVKSIIENLNLPFDGDIIEIVLSKMHVILEKIDDLVEFVKSLLDITDFASFDMTFLVDLITDLLQGELSDEEIQQITSEIESQKSDILTSAKEKVQEAMGLPDSDTPSIPGPPEIDASFLGIPDGVSFDLSALKMSVSLPDFEVPGIAKMVLDFIKGIATVAIDVIKAVKDAVTELIGKLKEGIQAVVAFILEKVMQPIIDLIKGIFPDFEKLLIPAVSFLTLMKRIVPMLIVGIVGFLIGPGLITLSIAKSLNLV